MEKKVLAILAVAIIIFAGVCTYVLVSDGVFTDADTVHIFLQKCDYL